MAVFETDSGLDRTGPALEHRSGQVGGKIVHFVLGLPPRIAEDILLGGGG